MKAFYLLFLVVFHVNIPLSAMKPSHNNDTYCWDNNEECWLKKAQDAFDNTTEDEQEVNQQESEAPAAQPEVVPNSINNPETWEDGNTILEIISGDIVEKTAPETWFQECPTQGTKFTCDYFKEKSYWPKAVSLPQNHKDLLLQRAFKWNCLSYSHDRCRLAGWACAGADTNEKILRDKIQFDYAIGYTVDRNDIAVTQILIDHGADVNKIATYNRRVLSFAKTKKMAKLLVNAGADIHDVSPECHPWYGTALYVLTWDRPSDLLDFYIKRGISVTKKDNHNETTLHSFARTARNNAFRTLPDARADNLRRQIRSLLRAGIDVDAKNNQGDTATDLVRDCRRRVKACKIIYNLIEQERKERAELTTRG